MNLEPGDWVTIVGQISDRQTHPDDICVELFSHNAQFDVDVLRDRIKPIEPPSVAFPCTSLYQREDGSLIECTLHHRHAEDHQHGKKAWLDADEYGRVDR